MARIEDYCGCCCASFRNFCSSSFGLLHVCQTLRIYSRMIPPGIYQMKSTSLYGYGVSKNFKMITPTISTGRGCVVAAGKKKKKGDIKNFVWLVNVLHCCWVLHRFFWGVFFVGFVIYLYLLALDGPVDPYSSALYTTPADTYFLFTVTHLPVWLFRYTHTNTHLYIYSSCIALLFFSIFYSILIRIIYLEFAVSLQSLVHTYHAAKEK